MVASFIDGVEEFFLTGLIALAIVFATIRAYFAKLLAYIDSAGPLGSFLACLLFALAAYFCFAIIRCCLWCKEVRDEENSSIQELDPPHPQFRMFPIFLDQGNDGWSRRSYRGRRGAIVLGDYPTVHPSLERQYSDA
ncbi:hypothetical protein B0H34DRAFT_799254 [Crassisporium funariophilum]|nr:hypothetical protein B0H34DRAFT_799254 [Crassisporium funariophilum]